ncbi:MAG: hypothetical protein AAFV33_12990 [Chloroflexota bacterium]
MAAEVGWLSQCHSAIYMRLAHDWTASDLVEAAHQWHDLAQMAPGDPVVVIDLSESLRMPDGLLSRMNEVTRLIPPGRYQTVIVGVVGSEARVVDTLIRTFFPAALKRLSFHVTLDDAMAFIAAEAPSARR